MLYFPYIQMYQKWPNILRQKNVYCKAKRYKFRLKTYISKAKNARHEA